MEAITALVGVVKKDISYLWNCTEHVESLKREAQNLVYTKERVEQRMYLATSKGEPLLPDLEEWMKKTNDCLSDAAEFINKDAQAKKRCFNLQLCVNMCIPHLHCKTVTKKINLVMQHQKDGKDFETCVSFPPPTPGFTDLFQSKKLENIDSQKSTLKKIIEALEDDTIQIVGINGLGGVGKTTIAREVAAKMNEQFEYIVFITVSQAVHTKIIQERVRVAASRITKGQKVLLVLDDLWEELRLDEVGIPSGSDYMNCKILLTSRNRDVCEAMNAQKNIPVNPLPSEEAWTLFEWVVGINEWGGSLKTVALDIVEECGGLPLFIQAVGKTLKNKEMDRWKAALHQLQAPNPPIDVDETFKRKTITQLKLSYDNLESEVAKSCFLLCCMFPEDGNISLTRLTHYGLALGIFDNCGSIQEAKNKVQHAVKSLKSSFLLLPKEEKEDELFKMHGLGRDMAMLIISKGNDKFWVRSGIGLTEWKPEKDLGSYKKISLIGNRVSKLPEHALRFPDLDTFLIQDNELSVVPEKFFQGMEKLKLLDMSCNNISSLPQSLKLLRELRLLDLNGNKSLSDISILGGLTCLEILKLRSTGIKEIPTEIGQLIKLRLLDVYSCENLSYVAPGVISKLNLLEELFVQCKGNFNFLEELCELKFLKVLHVVVRELRPETETNKGKSVAREASNLCCKCCLHILNSSLPFDMPIMKMIQVSERLKLWDVSGLNNILPVVYQEGFDELKYIELVGCANVKSLVKTCDMDTMNTTRKFFSRVEEINLEFLDSLELLWDRPHQYISFCNLTKIKIEYCSSLLELFPLTVAQGLKNLRSLKIVSCKSLKVVISAGDGQPGGSETELVKHDIKIMFFLTDIYLYDLPKLESFNFGSYIIEYPSLTSMVVGDCPIMNRWSDRDTHMPKMDFYHDGTKCHINYYIKKQREMNGNWRIWKKKHIPDDMKEVEKVAGSLAGKENVQTFKEEVEKHTPMKEKLQRPVENVISEKKDPGKDLENRKKNPNIKISEATKMINEEDESKMATKEPSSSIQKHQQDSERFKNRVSNPLHTPGFIDLYLPKDLENIDTQKSTLKTIIQAIKDQQIIGIVGLGGVGKTTLANEAAVKMKNQFNHIEYIVVSKDLDIEKIKKKVEVAGIKILRGEMVLIILDDVWEELKLDEVGIPCGSDYMNCKILLTSRIKDVCKAMNATVIEVKLLKEKEAWALFEQVVGNREWDELKQVGLAIVKKCGGLPLFLQAVGNALKDKEIKSWQEALDRLRDPLSDLVYKRKGIRQLKLSYDYLTDETAKSCFLLCSLFPEDAHIDLKRLESYGLALGIFNDPNCSMQSAKHRVQTAIDTLNSSFLLLSEKKGTVVFNKMHDLVRVMAMVITSEDNDTFCVRSGKGLVKWQPTKHLESYNKISLMKNKISKLPDHEFQFPQLDTFLIQDNKLSIVHDDFFQHMTKLKVLDMSGNKISSLPRSLEQLNALRMLDLSSNKSLCKISILGMLTCLEILKLRETGITNIPGEIGKLAKLRVLDVWKCDLPFVSQGVISKLIKLEELYIWSTEDVNCSFLGELSNLQSLTILHLCISKLEKIPENIRIETLIEFHFQNNEVNFLIDDGIRVLKISYISFPFEKPIIELIQASEALHLKGIKDSNEHGQRKTNRELSNLYSLEVLWDRPNRYTIFCNLVIIAIENFDSLSELFPVSVAEGLCQSEKNIYYGL